MKSNVLVTGGLGFIASHLSKLLLNFGYNVIIVDKETYASDIRRIDNIKDDIKLYMGDICNKKLIEKIIKEDDINIIINAAAETHVDNSIKDSSKFIRSNINGTHNLLEIVKENDLRFIQISTDEVYGSTKYDDQIFKETDKLNPGNPYCLPPDTKILLENGREIDIENVNEKDNLITLEKHNVTSFPNGFSYFPLSNNNRLINKSPINLFKKEYTNLLIDIGTEHGNIKCTPEHRLLIKRPKRLKSGKLDNKQSFDQIPVMEIPAYQIKKSDWLICARKIDFIGKESYSLDFWRFAGYFTGDGNIGKSGRSTYIHLADEDKELLSRYEEIIKTMTFDKEIFERYIETRRMIENYENKGIEITNDIIRKYSERCKLNFSRVVHWFKDDRKPIVHAIPTYYKHKTKNCWYLNFGHEKTVELLCILGLNVYANEKTVPNILFDSTDEEIAEFIAGYFDADGSIYNNTITFSSSSLDLLEGVKCLLRRFGIISTITKGLKHAEDGKIYTIYKLSITDNSSKTLFKENINIFKDPEKIEIGNIQENMFHNNVYYSTVKEIHMTKNKYNYVYDMEIEDTNNFVANGFLVHNSASKAAADLLCLAYKNTFDIDVVITRSSNNYGPFQDTEKFIPRMISLGMQGKDLEVYGDGNNIRDWIYVLDNVNAIQTVVEKGIKGEIYNISSYEEKTNNEIAEIIAEKFGVWIKHIEDRLGHDFRYSINNNKIMSRLGWDTKTTFEDGIKKTIDWYEKQGS